MDKSINSALFQTYKDLDLCFKIHPLYSDIVPIVELDALKNSIKNILLTRPGERPFQPRLGCALVDFLFEPMDIFTVNSIQDAIEYSIGLFEPRIELKEVIVEPNYDRNHYEVTIIGIITNYRKEVEISLVLERLR